MSNALEGTAETRTKTGEKETCVKMSLLILVYGLNINLGPPNLPGRAIM